MYATESAVEALGIAPVLGGLFISSTMSVLPEAVKTRVMVRVGESTAGTTSVVADNAVTMTAGFLPLALVEVSIDNEPLYVVNLVAVAGFAILFVLAQLTGGGRGVSLRHVVALGAAYSLYVVTALWVA